ncbi:MAG: nitrite reductase small subunit NirD [Candidatus Dormibacteria bacterium]
MSLAVRRAVARVEDIPPREGRSVSVGGEDVALFRCAGGIRAVANVCPHAGGPLADGIVAGDTVACPLHGRIVDLLSGTVSDCAEPVRVFPVSVEDGVVWLGDG